MYNIGETYVYHVYVHFNVKLYFIILATLIGAQGSMLVVLVELYVLKIKLRVANYNSVHSSFPLFIPQSATFILHINSCVCITINAYVHISVLNS